jgi:ABC-type nickel/cobalt efflux system permease component RcnA
MILPVVVYSAVYGVYGIWLTARAESARWRTLLVTSAVLAGSVAIWLLVQGLVHSF